MLQRLASLIAFSVILINCFSTSPALSQKSAPIRFNPPPPPPDRGLPGNRGEGASRGDCTALDLPLTALVPSYEQRLNQGAGETTITQVWGLTSVEQPSFWFYVPYNQSSIQAIEFVLKTDQNNAVPKIYQYPQYLEWFECNYKDYGFLETNKPYHWFFKVRVVCNPNQSATLDYVEGWVQRVNLDAALRDEFKQLLPQEQASIYAKNGIWYDALTTLAELLLTGSQHLGVAEDWKNLLKVIKLEKMSTKLLI
uniref:DUF928 domain-containing protein n=1 Tax=Anabaena sp. TaxID=1167 RepID=Q44226_9NOST|nr:ORF2 [Nostoc sp. PCC 7120 = FACHB-418]